MRTPGSAYSGLRESLVAWTQEWSTTGSFSALAAGLLWPNTRYSEFPASSTVGPAMAATSTSSGFAFNCLMKLLKSLTVGDRWPFVGSGPPFGSLSVESVLPLPSSDTQLVSMTPPVPAPCGVRKVPGARSNVLLWKLYPWGGGFILPSGPSHRCPNSLQRYDCKAPRPKGSVALFTPGSSKSELYATEQSSSFVNMTTARTAFGRRKPPLCESCVMSSGPACRLAFASA